MKVTASGVLLFIVLCQNNKAQVTSWSEKEIVFFLKKCSLTYGFIEEDTLSSDEDSIILANVTETDKYSTTVTLSIAKAEEEHAGHYTCTAQVDDTEAVTVEVILRVKGNQFIL